MLQAMLHQVSGKLGDTLVALAVGSSLSLAILGEQVLFEPQVDVALVAKWMSLFYPLILFFLYVFMRLAEVTEKAGRVAPLVNSWSFQEDRGEMPWMDQSRQYAVQYINQSRAGFYVGGARLRMPDVQKVAYYLAAISFALLSRLIR